MGERGKDRLPCNQPGKQKKSYNEKKAVERITAQRHACERHQQEMRQKHDVILQKLSHRDNELRHILQQLTREQSSLTYNGDDGWRGRKGDRDIESGEGGREWQKSQTST